MADHQYHAPIEHLLRELAQLQPLLHANSFEAQKFAVDGDVDVIAHGMWNWGSPQSVRTPGRNQESPGSHRGQEDWLPIDDSGHGRAARAFRSPIPDHANNSKRHSGGKCESSFNSPQGKWFKKEISEDDTSDAAVLEGFDGGPLRRVRQVVSYLASKDANFLFGTDTPSAPTYGNLPGLDGYLEMQPLKKAGLSLEQIFRAATINHARKFKIDSQVGTIGPGKIATLVLLKKSPLEVQSVHALQSHKL